MGRLLALADLHLSGTGDKPMDRFGDLWVDHANRMAAAWDQSVRPDDWVLLPGDLSWARNLDEAACDLAWIGDRPGRKLLLRGNHDSWWGSRTKVRRALPGGCEILHNSAHPIGAWVVLGSRGWLCPDDPIGGADDRKVFARELHRLDLSIADAERFDSGHPRLAMCHYPPWVAGREPSDVVCRLRQAGVSVCVYGHLHGEDHALAIEGSHDGIRYHFVAADAVGFRPVVILEDVERG
jgi:predicted phosphohydrolase